VINLAQNSEKSKTTTFQVVITGKVQGVFFRSTLKNVAQETGVNGWTRNLPDGSVEALLQGDESKVQKVIEWCHIGPRGAHVVSVKASPIDETKSYRSFAVLP
jgi:acylphosphatase